MKKILKPFVLPALLVAFFVFFQVFIAVSQQPPPPPGEKGSGTNQSPMSGPIDGGVVVFLAFAAGLAGKEYYKNLTRKTAE